MSINIVKRDGRVEPYQVDKLLKVISWACDDKEFLSKILLESMTMKISNMIKISTLYEELITTAVNLISPLQPMWDEVAKKLYLMKLYKETYDLKEIGYYPDYDEVLLAGLASKTYSSEVFASFSPEEVIELSKFIVPNRDLNFTYKGLYLMNSRYCGRSSSGIVFELPQHTYLKIAIFSFWKEDKSIRMNLIKKEYDALSTHLITMGTPRVLNSSNPKAQLASCVLSTVDDDTKSITETVGNLSVYSKFSGGLALDVSLIRSSGSKIHGNRGVSNGPVPFIKLVEGAVSAFNQSGTRSGACVVTYPFWHFDVMNLLMLNDAGGTEDNRARKLKYSMRIHNILKERVESDGNITLFNPQDVPKLNSTHGEEFSKYYELYEKDNSIRKKTLKARELFFLYLKVRKETGNTYAFFADNVNEQSVVGDFIGASNLCAEITVTSSPSTNHSSKLIVDEDGVSRIIETSDSGEIGLCNLFSVNLVEWYKLSYEEKVDFMSVLLRGSDNIIDYQFYPVKEARNSNIKKRPIGIGVSNYAHLLASQGLLYTDNATLEFTHKLFEELYYIIYSCSIELAKERTPFSYFKNTNWSKGETPLSLSILNKIDNSELDNPLNYPLQYDWDKLGEDIERYGVRFSLHGAIPPTATSGRIISATESTEPILDLFVMDDGAHTLPSLAPNLDKYRQFYQRAYEIPTSRVIELAAIRQKFIDQAQSINTYYIHPESAGELAKDIFLAMDLGVKTLYYLLTPKANYDINACESCT